MKCNNKIDHQLLNTIALVTIFHTYGSSKSKVTQLDDASLRYEDVLWLHVSMQDLTQQHILVNKNTTTHTSQQDHNNTY